MFNLVYNKVYSVVYSKRENMIQYFRRLIRFFALPYCYVNHVDWDECRISRWQVAKDFCYIFFKLKYYPDNYSACRLWEKSRGEWAYYFGSSYDPYQRLALRRLVQPYEYEICFEDKEVCAYLCEGIGISIPETLGVVDNNQDWEGIVNNILRKRNYNRIILKPVRGSSGRGISVVDMTNGSPIVYGSGAKGPLSLYQVKERMIVQNFVNQHVDMRLFSHNSLNTLRILTLLTKRGEVLILSALMRFGQGDAYIDNWSAGGVAVGIEIDTGKLKKNGYDKNGKVYQHEPLTGKPFDSLMVPEWGEVIGLSRKVQYSFPYYKLLGLDIAVTDKGEAILIEINGFPDIVMQEQACGPLLKNYKNFKEFREYDLLINKLQAKLFSTMS